MHKTFVTILSFLSTVVVAHSQPGWRLLNSGITAEIRDVAFATTEIGCVIATDNTVLQTMDGGASWKRIMLPSSLDSTWRLSRIVFSDRNTAFITGGRFESNEPLLLRSIDGGSHWSSVAFLADLDHYTFFSVSFPTPTTGYLTGSNHGGPNGTFSVVAKTTDGGVTWRAIDLPGLSGSFGVVDFRDNEHGMLITNHSPPSGSVIVATSDGGQSWRSAEPIEWLQRTDRNAISHTPDGVWLASSDWDIARSTDDGASWEIIPFPSGDKPAVIRFAFASNTIGYAMSEPFTSHRIWKTVDGGRSWSADAYNVGEGYYNACSAPSESIAYVVGSNGMIIKTTTGGSSSVKEDVRSGTDGIRVVPQPVTTVATIEFPSLGREESLRIFNVRGEEIRRIEIPSGSSRATISDLQSGPYWCRFGNLSSRFFSIR
ncbi:MAG: YCF48-related protein [Bacteroidota bacterium]